MHKYIQGLIFSLVWSHFSFAQSPLSLEQAMELAVQRNYGLKNQAITVSIADKALEKLRAGRQPVISGNGDLRYNPILQTVIIPGEAFGQPGGAPEKVRFGTRFNLLAGIDASWKAVDPVYRTAESASLIESKIESQRLNQNKLDVELEAAEAFYDVAFQLAQVKLADARRSRANDLEKIIRTGIESGSALPVDGQKSALDAQHAEAQYQQAQNQLLRARLKLGYLVGLSGEQLVLPADFLISDTSSSLLAKAYPESIENCPELSEAQLRLEWRQLQVVLEDKRNLPGLEFYANMSAQHLSDALSVWNRWFPFAFVGVRTSIPLYDGQLKARQKEMSLLQEQIARNQVSDVKESLAFELEAAMLDREHALISMRDAGRSLALTADVLKLEQIRMEEGVLLLADLREAEYALREAENTYLSAIRQYAVAQLRLARASGRIH
jgi:outer membrane protein